jgi:hypothetical protein
VLPTPLGERSLNKKIYVHALLMHRPSGKLKSDSYTRQKFYSYYKNLISRNVVYSYLIFVIRMEIEE